MGRALGAAALANDGDSGCVLTACGSDDNRPSASARSLVGTRRHGGLRREKCGDGRGVDRSSRTRSRCSTRYGANTAQGKAWPTTRRGRVPAASSSSQAMSISPGQIRPWSRVRFARRSSAATETRPGICRWCSGQSRWSTTCGAFSTLIVNADVLAKIFSGKITRWSDPILAALNGGVALPDTKITPIYRSDSSGTTDSLQRYLTTAAADGVGPEALARNSRAAPAKAL